MQVEYVVGFLYDKAQSRVVLIEKNRSVWQQGRLNGVGGRVEPGETPAVAMRREFREEVRLDVDNWELVVIMAAKMGWVHFFSACGLVELARSTTDEKIWLAEVNDLPPNVLCNLRWLIPLCLDPDVQRPVSVFDKEVAGQVEKDKGGHDDTNNKE